MNLIRPFLLVSLLILLSFCQEKKEGDKLELNYGSVQCGSTISRFCEYLNDSTWVEVLDLDDPILYDTMMAQNQGSVVKLFSNGTFKEIIDVNEDFDGETGLIGKAKIIFHSDSWINEGRMIRENKVTELMSRCVLYVPSEVKEVNGLTVYYYKIMGCYPMTQTCIEAMLKNSHYSIKGYTPGVGFVSYGHATGTCKEYFILPESLDLIDGK